MKNNYTINKKRSKGFIYLLVGLLFISSCKDLNDLNPIKGSIKNQQNENLFLKALKLKNPYGELISPNNIIYSPTEIEYLFELDPENLKGSYELHSTYSNGTNKVSEFTYEEIEASSSKIRQKRAVGPVFYGLMLAIGGSIIRIFAEAGGSSSKLKKPKPVPPRVPTQPASSQETPQESLPSSLSRPKQPTSSNCYTPTPRGSKPQTSCPSHVLSVTIARQPNQTEPEQGNELPEEILLIDPGHKLPEEIENPLVELDERVSNLKKQYNFNAPENQVTNATFSRHLDGEDNLTRLIEFSSNQERESRSIREQREILEKTINQINFFQQRIESKNYKSLRSNAPPEFNRITESQLSRLDISHLKALSYRLRKIRRVAFSIDIKGMQSEFFARFLAYQGREAETIHRIQEVDNEIREKGTSKERKILREGLTCYLDAIITIQKMLLRGIVLAQHALKTENTNESAISWNRNQLGVIRNGLMKIIKNIDKAIEEEKYFYELITSEKFCVTEYEASAVKYKVFSCFLQVDSLNQIFDREPIQNNESTQTTLREMRQSRNQNHPITGMEPIHSITIFSPFEELKFDSIETINAELSDFIKSSTQGS